MPLHIVHTQNIFVELINCNVWRGLEGSFNSISKGELSHLSLAKVHNAHASRRNLMCMKIVQHGTEVAVKSGMQNQNGEFSIRRKKSQLEYIVNSIVKESAVQWAWLHFHRAWAFKAVTSAPLSLYLNARATIELPLPLTE